MITFKDMCFCGTIDCKKRSKCARALENYKDKAKEGKMYFSMATFDCRNEDRNMFIKFKGE